MIRKDQRRTQYDAMICMTKLASRLGNDGKMSWDPLVKFHGTEYYRPRGNAQFLDSLKNMSLLHAGMVESYSTSISYILARSC